MVSKVEFKKRQFSEVSDDPSKRVHKTPQKKTGKRKYKAKRHDATSPIGVLQFEINELKKEYKLSDDSISNDLTAILNDKDVEQVYNRIVKNVEVLRLSSNGDGLAVIPHPTKPDGKQICVVPFGLPGDIADVKVFKSHPSYVESDLLNVISPSNIRNDSLINCRYFGKCSGCQFQNISYNQQLELKRSTIINAYKFLAPVLMRSSSLPEVKKTVPSPMQFSYRTKLTPHFNLPYKLPEDYPVPSLGFGAKGRPSWRKEAEGGDFSILDIEECPIGTDIINKGMLNERGKFKKAYKCYKKGATILLREDSNLLQNSNLENVQVEQPYILEDYNESAKMLKTCITDSRQIVTEYVNGMAFQFSAGEFFQNNNSILSSVISYVKSNLELPKTDESDKQYLVDAYCGSGLFSISCSEKVEKVIGVEVSADSVKFAEKNALANNIQNAKFIVGKAEHIFATIDTPSNRTSVILDPPRKGCDDVFLNQLSDFCPARIVYVSCNVHSQARDIEWFINSTKNGSKYEVESIRGFDFFPQTHHVESVAVLIRI